MAPRLSFSLSFLALFTRLSFAAGITQCPTVPQNVTLQNGSGFSICVNTDYQNYNYQTLYNVNSATDCVTACGQYNGCNGAVFDHTDLICYIKGNLQNPTWVRNQQYDTIRLAYQPNNGQPISSCPWGASSYASTSGTGYTICPASDYRGPSINIIQNINSDALCAEQCSASSGCVQAVFDRYNNICHIKGASNQLSWVASNQFDTITVAYTPDKGRPLVNCPYDQTQYSSGLNNFLICPSTDYHIPSIVVLGNIASAKACADLCGQNQNCQAAVYDHLYNYCHFKATTGNGNWDVNTQFDAIQIIRPPPQTVGYRLVGSSGVAAQMVFLPPMTSKAVFIDNYHQNAGGPGYQPQTNTFGLNWVYNSSSTSVFGAEFDWSTTQLRTLQPKSNTFCSAGAFWPDGTLMNMAGAEPGGGVGDGFQAIRTYAPGPCANNVCTQDWVESGRQLDVRRWYPSAQTLTDGGILVVGGSNAGGLVTNFAEINVPTYEKQYQNGASTAPITLPILNFTAADDSNPLRSYNLYPNLHLLPNSNGANLIFQNAAVMNEVWNYDTNKQYKALPNAPKNQPRTFPASGTTVMLPIRLKDTSPTILLCGGSSADMPNPQALNDCSRIRPLDTKPAFTADDNLPNGPQTMSNGILLPDGTVLLLNGARVGSGGGFMADSPVLTPVIYTPSAAAGSRFKSLPGATIPRLYHSTAILLPTGEVLVAGSNPAVGFSSSGQTPADPHFWNYDRQSFLVQQQSQNNIYPTEYRVEIFAPPYMNATARPILSDVDASAAPAAKFRATLNFNGLPTSGTIVAFLSNPGFSTHGVTMGQRMVELQVANANGKLTITAPPNRSYAPPGYYLLFVSVNGIPSQGSWIKIT